MLGIRSQVIQFPLPPPVKNRFRFGFLTWVPQVCRQPGACSDPLQPEPGQAQQQRGAPILVKGWRRGGAVGADQNLIFPRITEGIVRPFFRPTVVSTCTEFSGRVSAGSRVRQGASGDLHWAYLGGHALICEIRRTAGVGRSAQRDFHDGGWRGGDDKLPWRETLMTQENGAVQRRRFLPALRSAQTMSAAAFGRVKEGANTRGAAQKGEMATHFIP